MSHFRITKTNVLPVEQANGEIIKMPAFRKDTASVVANFPGNRVHKDVSVQVESCLTAMNSENNPEALTELVQKLVKLDTGKKINWPETVSYISYRLKNDYNLNYMQSWIDEYIETNINPLIAPLTATEA